MLQTVLRRYAGKQAAAVSPFVVGRRILDLGAGEGYLAPVLCRSTSRFICSVDVGLFRRAPGPYVLYDGGRLPFADGSFDTTLILLTLHHCTNAEGVLDEALRVTRRRLIVIEPVYRTRLERLRLRLLDARLNGYRHGGRMHVPLALRRPEGWRALFESRGLRAMATQMLGPWWERLVHHPLMFVLEKPPPAADRPEPMAHGNIIRPTGPRPGAAAAYSNPQRSDPRLIR